MNLESVSCGVSALSTSTTETRCRSALKRRIPGTIPWEFEHDSELRTVMGISKLGTK